MTSQLPPLSKDLIEALEKLYPDHCPDLVASERSIWFDAGRVSVVKFLRRKLEEQDALSSLNTPITL